MTEFERINAPRVAKMVAMMETILKSARSNRVGEREVQQLLEPLRNAQRGMSDLSAPMMPPGVELTPEPQPAPSAAPRDTKPRVDLVLQEQARTAPLDDLMAAYTTITCRLADLVTDTKEL